MLGADTVRRLTVTSPLKSQRPALANCSGATQNLTLPLFSKIFWRKFYKADIKKCRTT